MKNAMAYLKSKRGTICFFIMAVAVFAAAFALYRLPLAAVLYPAGIAALTGLAFVLWDARKTRKKCRELAQIATKTADVMGDLPAPDTLPEAAWAHLAESLREELAQSEAAHRDDYRNMVDYYTVWAHQIKTPIASMKLLLQNEDTELARQLRSDLFRTQQYVDMVLAFLRLGSDSTDYVFRSVALDTVIRPSARKFAPEFIHRKLRLQYEPITETLVTDEKWLAFVLEQLLSNALKYTKEGGIRVFMAEERTLCIEDTGIGIVPEDLPRIFEKGYTGGNGRLDRNASGLGLYLCKQVCEKLGIGIRITSRVGKGTRVVLLFPEGRAYAE